MDIVRLVPGNLTLVRSDLPSDPDHKARRIRLLLRDSGGTMGWYGAFEPRGWRIVGRLLGPVLSYDFGPLAMFGSLQAGPAYQLIDVTDGSQTGENGSKSGLVLSTEVAGGLQVPITGDWFMRARGFWSRAGEVEQVGGGVELAVRFDWFGGGGG